MREESTGNAAETGVVEPSGDEEPSAPGDELEALADEFGDESLDELEEIEEHEELEEVERLEEEEELEAAEYRTTLLHPARPPAGDQEEEEEEEEELALEDTETALDELLAEQWGGEPVFGPAVLPGEEEAEEAEKEGAWARASRDASDVGVPHRRPDEFVCRSCFLVKHLRLLADKERQICRDCAA